MEIPLIETATIERAMIPTVIIMMMINILKMMTKIAINDDNDGITIIKIVMNDNGDGNNNDNDDRDNYDRRVPVV